MSTVNLNSTTGTAKSPMKKSATKKTKAYTSYQGLPMSKADVDACYESFCYMLLEDFMMKKNMNNSLRAFREEYTPPDEV